MGEARRRRSLMGDDYGKPSESWSKLQHDWSQQSAFCLGRVPATGDICFTVPIVENEALKMCQRYAQSSRLCEYALQHFREEDRGILHLVDAQVLQSCGFSTKGHLEFNYYHQLEIKIAPRQSILIGDSNAMRPFLLWAIEQYDPEQEYIAVFAGVPLIPDKPRQRFHAVLKVSLNAPKDEFQTQLEQRTIALTRDGNLFGGGDHNADRR